MKGRRAAPAPGAGRVRAGTTHRTAGWERARRVPPSPLPPPLEAAAATGTTARVLIGACPRAPARASRRAAPGVPGWGRPGARARGRGRCPAAVLPGQGDRSRERGPGRRVPTPTPLALARASCAPPPHPLPDRGRERGSCCCAPGPLCPGKPWVLEPAFGLSGLPRARGRARCPLLPLWEDLIERHHIASLLGFAWFLVFCFAQTQTLLTNVASVYFWVGLLPLCLKQDCNVTTALV